MQTTTVGLLSQIASLLTAAVANQVLQLANQQVQIDLLEKIEIGIRGSTTVTLDVAHAVPVKKGTPA